MQTPRAHREVVGVPSAHPVRLIGLYSRPHANHHDTHHRGEPPAWGAAAPAPAPDLASSRSPQTCRSRQARLRRVRWSRDRVRDTVEEISPLELAAELRARAGTIALVDVREP